jgi:hypothetical protein
MTDKTILFLIDRSTMPLGPWVTEPDLVEWTEDGYSFLIKRHPLFGHLNGYVGITKGHPWHGEDYDLHYGLGVHGGLTFAEAMPDKDPSIWWFGFDCNHCTDYAPLYSMGANPGSYKDLAYVEDQLKILVDALKEGAKAVKRSLTEDETRLLQMDEEDLDEEVHDAKSAEASDINNGGVLSQIAYLLGITEAEVKTLQRLLKNSL